MFDENSNSMPDQSAKKKILLAEDDSSMRRFVEVLLQRAGYKVSSAEDGLAAMQLALSEDFDAVVADAMMPNMTGYDLCRMMRLTPGKEGIPLIILSGLEQEGGAPENESLADAYLLKGTELTERLTETLSRLLSPKVSS